MKTILDLRLSEYARSITKDDRWSDFKENLDRFYFAEWQKASKPELREQIYNEYKAFRRFSSKLEALDFSFAVRQRETG